MKNNHFLKSQNGSAIIQALVYTSLLAVVLVTALTFYTDQTKTSKSQLKFSTRDELRNSISSYIQVPEALNISLIDPTCSTNIQNTQVSGNNLNNTFFQCLPHVASGVTAYSASSDPDYPEDAGYVPFVLRSPFDAAVVIAGTKANPVYYDELGNRCNNANCPFKAYTMYRVLSSGINGEPSVDIKFRLDPNNYNTETTIKAKAYEVTNQISLYQINRRSDPAKVELCTNDAGVVQPGMIRVGVIGNIAETDLETQICVPAIGTQVCAPDQFQTGIRADGSPICGGRKGTCPSGFVIVGMRNGAGAVEPACMDARCNNKLDSGVYRFGFVSPGNLSNATNGVECVLIRPLAGCDTATTIRIKKGLTNLGELTCDSAAPPPASCPVPLPPAQTITNPCAPPLIGSIVQSRSFVCPPAPGAWGAWTTVSSTCVAGPTCGMANGVSSATTPAASLCATGAASAVVDAGTLWTWTCDNAPAPSANCSAPKTSTPAPTSTPTPTPSCDTTSEYPSLASCEAAKGVGNCSSTTSPSGPPTCSGSYLCNSSTLTATNSSACSSKAVGDTCSFSQTCPNSGTWLIGLEPQKCQFLSESVCPWLPGPQPATCLSTDADCKLLSSSPIAALTCPVRRCSASGMSSVTASGTCTATTITVFKQSCGVATPTPSPVNGVCGTANGSTSASAPTTNLCADGATPAVSGSGPWSWTCPGSSGGSSSPVCTAFQSATPVAGVCGSANGTTTPTAPTTNLCANGATPAVSGTGPWTWTCPGSSGGPSSPLCTALAAATPVTLGDCEITFKDPMKAFPETRIVPTGATESLPPGSTIISAGSDLIVSGLNITCPSPSTPTPVPTCGTYTPTSATMAGNFGVYSGNFGQLNHRCTPSPLAKTARIGGAAADGSQYYCEAGGYACLSGYNTSTPSASTPVAGTWQIVVNEISSYNSEFYYGDCSFEPAVGASCLVRINTMLYQGINGIDPTNQSFMYCSPDSGKLRIWKCVPD